MSDESHVSLLRVRGVWILFTPVSLYNNCKVVKFVSVFFKFNIIINYYYCNIYLSIIDITQLGVIRTESLF